jgi:hypothetical protein
MRTLAIILGVIIMNLAPAAHAEEPWMHEAVAAARGNLLGRFGEAQRVRIDRGLDQVARFWRAEDGDAAAFHAFVTRYFAGDQAAVDTQFTRFQLLLEQLDGHMGEIGRAFRTQADLDLGPMQPYDELFAAYDPGAHLADDFFANKLAFTVLLNFPLTTLQERTTAGAGWSRRQWAETRLAHRFARRIPSSVQLAIADAAAKADQYIAEYNIWMHHVVNDRGERLFPAGMRLLAHWNLRDEIKASYALGKEGLPRQRAIQTIMDRIVTQTIPAMVVNNPQVDWNPVTNTVARAGVSDAPGAMPAPAAVSSAAEPDTRYAVLLETFRASRLADPFSPTAPTLIARRFDENRELPEERVRAILESVVGSPLVPRIARLIAQRLGRPLEPFDIWYNGFRPSTGTSETDLDAIVRKKYPTPEAFRNDIPVLLGRLGFTPERAAWLAGHIVVDPARGSGHAMGAAMRGVPAHLRTRIGPEGMNYKGFNIAVHEMGHNVEQTISINLVDHTLLQGVPNTAFTEAMAFVFQARDLALLGLAPPAAGDEAVRTIDDFWMTYEIAGVALVDMAVWHWMYDHPSATPAELRDAVLGIARSVWNTYYAPVFGTRDVVLLGVYSHMIHSFLYLPDYPLGHLIAFQIEEHVRTAGSVGAEVERMAKLGSIGPDLWMRQATGAPVGAEALLTATARAVTTLEQHAPAQGR